MKAGKEKMLEQLLFPEYKVPESAATTASLRKTMSKKLLAQSGA